MLTQLLGSQARARIIAALLVAPGGRLHLRALARAAGGSVSSAQREVERLEAMGLVSSAVDEGGRRQVVLVADHAFAGPLGEMLAADPRAQYEARVAAVPNLDASVEQVLGEWVDAIVTGFAPLRIVLFGSRALGTAAPDSDVDLLVVLPEVADKGSAMVAIKTAVGRRTIGLDVIPTDEADIESQRSRRMSVVTSALDEGVLLYDRSA